MSAEMSAHRYATPQRMGCNRLAEADGRGTQLVQTPYVVRRKEQDLVGIVGPRPQALPLKEKVRVLERVLSESEGLRVSSTETSH